MTPLLKVFLSFLCKLRFTKSFINHCLKRWAPLLAFLRCKLGVWRLWGEGKRGTVTFPKAEQAEHSLRSIRTHLELREYGSPPVVAASYVPAPATASNPSQRHGLSAARQLAPPAPAHLTAGPHRGYTYPKSALGDREHLREHATAELPPTLHRTAHGPSASSSREPLLRPPSPADSFQLLPLSSHVRVRPIPLSVDGHCRKQLSVDVDVAIEGPSTESLPLSLSVNTAPPRGESYAIASPTTHSSPISGVPDSRDESPRLSPAASPATLAPTFPGVVLKLMNPEQIPRYTKDDKVPCTGANYKIEPLTTTFSHVPENIHPEQCSLQEDCPRWVSATHPDGGLYYFDQDKGLFTDTDMRDPELRDSMEKFYRHLQEITHHDRIAIPSQKYDLVLDVIKDRPMQWSYYFACHESRSLFWLEKYDVKDMSPEVLWVESPTHVKHLLEALYWSHWSLYPAVFEGRCLEPAIYDELLGILSHGCMDVMTSKSSTLPYDDDTMQKMIGLVRNAKESDSDLMYHTAAVTRLLSFFAHWRFVYFHGQKNARLDKHQTVYRGAKRERTPFITFLSLLLFLAPEVHLQEMEKLWTDEIIVDTAWKSFISKLLEEWQELLLLSTVMLSANVGFLAIPGLVVSDPSNNITRASQAAIFATPAQIASYVSMEASVGSIVIGLLLVRHNRSKQKEDPAGASDYLRKNTSQVLGLEPMAIIFSLPWALLMWAMVMFFIALLLVCFRISNLSTRILVGVTSAIVVVLIGWCIVWSWKSGDSGKVWLNSLRALDVTRVFGNRFICLTPRRVRQSSHA